MALRDVARLLRLPGVRADAGDSTLENPSVDLITALNALDDGLASSSGIRVTPERALRLGAVFACVRVIAETVGSLPLPVYRTEGRSRIRVPSDRRWPLLNEQPNPEMTAAELWEMTTGHQLLWGNGYQYAVRNGRGDVAELWPLRPDITRPVRAPNGERLYETQLESGEPVILDPSEVIPYHAFATQPGRGLSPIGLARNELGNALAATEWSGRFFANNARPDGVIEIPHSMTDQQFEDFSQRWKAGHQGLKRSHLVGVLTGGAAWKDVGLPPEDLQFIEQQKMSVRGIARMFRVPPHKIGDLEGTVTRASIEQQAIDFVVDSLRPWLVRMEQRIKLALFTSAERAQGLYPEFLVDGLMRGDIQARFTAYGLARQWGWLSVNDILELENRPGIGPDGDIYLQPLNMGPAGVTPPALLNGDQAAARALLADVAASAGYRNGR